MKNGLQRRTLLIQKWDKDGQLVLNKYYKTKSAPISYMEECLQTAKNRAGISKSDNRERERERKEG